jgi:hypothetical protein
MNCPNCRDVLVEAYAYEHDCLNTNNENKKEGSVDEDIECFCG